MGPFHPAMGSVYTLSCTQRLLPKSWKTQQRDMMRYKNSSKESRNTYEMEKMNKLSKDKTELEIADVDDR